MKDLNRKKILIIFVLALLLVVVPSVLFARSAYFKYRWTDKNCQGNNCPSFKTDQADYAFCKNNHWCVYDGKCYNYTDFLKVNKSKEFCATAQGGIWVDPDTLKLGGGRDVTMCEYMGYRISRAGERRVGEYSNTTTNECCGDDRNEYFKQGRDGTSACCNSKYDYVKNGKCYSKKSRLVK